MTRLEGCFTTVEKRMISEGAFLQVREIANDVPGLDAASLHGDRRGRHRSQVAAFFSQVSHDPDMALLSLSLLEQHNGWIERG